MKKTVLMLGGLCVDRYYRVAHFPMEGQDTLIQDTFERVGGCPVNAAFTMKKFGLEPVLYSAVGAESQARVFAFFERNGLNTEGLFIEEDQKTGFCTIILDEKKERTFMTYRGCEGIFDAGRIPQVCRPVRHCYLTGLYLVYGQESEKAVDFLKTQSREGCEIYFDPGPLLDQIDPELLESMMNLCTHLKVNREESAALQRRLKISDLTVYFNKKLKSIVLTDGGRGAELITPNERRCYPAMPIQLVDSNGAGDAFFAGYAASLITGESFDEAMKNATACGALTAMMLGPHAEGNFQDLLKLRQQHGM